MKAAQWGKAKEAFHRAYELPAEEREGYLETLDEDLRGDVRSLLRHDPGDFLEKPATQYAVEMLRQEAAPERLGPYRLVKELGQGGMATVYLGERADGQFEKRVAVKILHSSIAEGEQRGRFLQERQLLANLDHANIVGLIDGNVTPDGRPYLVEDYVEGTPITEHAALRNLTRQERIGLFLQVVEAVEYAHGAGVVHGDLKPENILTTAEGKVKLIDFGISRMGGDGVKGCEVMRYWTPGYGAPEQARGEAVCPASDVYSLGAVLFELSAGRRFAGTWNDVPGIRGALRTLLKRCLSAEVEERPSAGELRVELQRIATPGVRWMMPTLVAVATVAVVGVAYWYASRTPMAPELRSIPVAAEASFEYEPVLSPNGTDVVYAWNEGAMGRGINLYRKAVNGGAAARLTFAQARDAFPQYSPDGRELLFSRSSLRGVEIVRLDLRTGRERVIHRIASELEGRQRSIRWAAWMADGKQIVLVQRREPSGPYALFVASAEGVVVRQLTFPPENTIGDQQAAASPDGRYLAFVRYATGSTSDIHLISLIGGETRQITRHATNHNGLSWSPDSRHIYFGARIRSALWSIYRMEADTGEVQRVAGTEGNSSWPMVAGFGGRLRMVYMRDEESVNVRGWTAPYRAGGQVNLCPSTLFDGGVNVSQDARHVAMLSTRGGSTQIWVCHVATGKAEVVSDPAHPRADSPRWSPDGRQIAYTVTENDSTDIAVADRSSGQVRRLRMEGSKEGRPSWSRDGKYLYFRSDRDGVPRIWKMRAGGEASSAVAVTGRDAYEAMESPDGRWVYFAKDRAHPGIYRMAVDGGAEELVVEGVREGWWSMASDGLYWIRNRDGKHFVERLVWGSRETQSVVTLPEGGGIWSGFAVSADGRTVYWTQTTRQSVDAMMLDGL